MTNDLTTNVSSPFAPIADRAASLALAAASNLLARDYPAAPEILSEPIHKNARVILERRLALLEWSLAAAKRSEHPRMALAIAGLLGAFHAAASGSLESAIAKYVQVCSDAPAWAVIQACADIESGRADGVSLDYRPAAPRVRQVAEDILSPWKEEYFKIRRVLNAPAMQPENEAMREKIRGLFKTFADGFRMGKFRKEGKT